MSSCLPRGRVALRPARGHVLVSPRDAPALELGQVVLARLDRVVVQLQRERETERDRMRESERGREREAEKRKEEEEIK